ncbi:MAG: T9SS type A sorting domain-containing protein [Ignavibacteriae bacterium]|nr:T9SS type A sorting domain-containing protein [Ignavibacteriota bacterium]
MFDKKGLHTGAPRGFTNGIGQIVNKQKKVPPSKHNNRLMAEVLALKFNIAASALQVTPKGFGELVYEEVDNPLTGLMIKQIGLRADTFLTYWKNVDTSVFYNLDTTIRKINLAFNGDIDSTSFAVRTTLKGYRSVADVPFLRPNPGVEPVIFADDRSMEAIFSSEIPDVFALHQNYPNPFNPTTTLSFDLPTTGYVNLTIYDMLGKEVNILLQNELMDAGAQYYEFDASSLPSGIYYYRINVTALSEDDEYSGERNFVSTKKMMLIR